MAEGKPNDLLARLFADDYFAPIHGKLNQMLDPANFIGRAPEQVEAFLKYEVEPALAPYADVLSGEATLAV